MKFRQMRRIHSLIPEHPIDTKHPSRLKPTGSIGQFIQHLCTRGSSMCSQHQFTAFVLGPGVTVSNTPIVALLVDFPYTFEVVGVGGRDGSVRRGREIESILEVSRGVLLRDKESVKVPEGGFDKGVCRHLLE